MFSLMLDAFLNCCNVTFLLKNVEKEGLNFSQMAVCKGFSMHKCEILWFLS